MDKVRLGEAYAIRLGSLRGLIETLDGEIRRLEARTHRQLRDDRGYRVIQQLNGVGSMRRCSWRCGS